MTFLNSIFLAALAAVVIPLLIHFLSRRRIKIVDFSSLKFLMTMQKSKLRWLKILEAILLIIRMMIIALIALAFARPALTGKQTSSHAPASVVMLIDDSPSLERLSAGGIVFDDLKRGALEIIGMLKPNDEVTIIALSGETRIEGSFSDIGRAAETINGLQTQAASANFKIGLEKALEILSASHNLNREIYILSDYQSGSWWDYNFDDVIDDKYRYIAIKFANDKSENVGIATIEFPPRLLAPGEEFEIKAEIKNYNDKAAGDRLLEIYIDGNKRAQTTVALKPLDNSESSFNIITEIPGSHRGYFELEDDDYGPDNRFYFNFDIPDRIKVLGVAENAQDARMLYNILGRTETGYIQFSGVNMIGFSQKNLGEYDVIILNDISALSPGILNSLADFVNSGKGLFLIFGSKSNPNSYSAFLEENAGISVEPFIAGASEKTSQSYFDLDNFDLTHPIFKIYSPGSLESPDIPQIKVYGYYPLDGGKSLAAIGSANTVLALADQKRILLLSFGLNNTDSDLSLHSFIVPFIIRSVEFLASSQATDEEYFLSGGSININLPGRLSSSSVRLGRSSGFNPGDSDNTLIESELIEVNRGAYGAFINIPHAGYPGFYYLIDNEDTITTFAVNHSSLESSSETLSPDNLRDILGQGLIVIDQKENIQETVMQAKFGFELWKYCLLLALLLLITESILVRKAR